MSSRPGAPPQWKTAVIVWLAIYPALTFILWLVGPSIQSWALPLRTLVMMAMLVPLMVYVLLPGVQRLFATWLRPSGKSTEAIDPSQK